MAELYTKIKRMKYVLLWGNFIFLLMGILAMIGGSLIIQSNFASFLESYYYKSARIMIAVGVVILLVSCIGCIAVSKESTMLVNVYAVMLSLLTIMEICAGISMLVMRFFVLHDIRHSMVQGLKGYTKSDSAKNAWDVIQRDLHCCGVETPHDWILTHVEGKSVTFEEEEFTVPYSCCMNLPNLCVDIYKEGCSKSCENYLFNASIVMHVIITAIYLLQILAVIIATVLAKAIRSIKTEQEMERQLNMHRDFEQRIDRKELLGVNRDTVLQQTKHLLKA